MQILAALGCRGASIVAKAGPAGGSNLPGPPGRSAGRQARLDRFQNQAV